MNDLETPIPPAPTSQTSQLATWSLVLGLLSIFCLGFLAAIPAVVCGHMALPRIKRSGGTLDGGGLAIAGLIIGYISMVLNLLILPAILLPAFANARGKAQEMRASVEIRSMATAADSYYMTYARYPPSEDNAELIAALSGKNPNKTIFLEVAPERLVDGAYVDPWGSPYRFAIDRDGNGVVEVGARKLDAGCAVWSDGRNRVNEGGANDDVTSWSTVNYESEVLYE